MRFTIRELVLVTVIVALGGVVWRDHSSQRMLISLEKLKSQRLEHLVELVKAPIPSGPSGELAQQLKAEGERRAADMVRALDKRIEKERQRSGFEPD
jgi:hypothetical protein